MSLLLLLCCAPWPAVIRAVACVHIKVHMAPVGTGDRKCRDRGRRFGSKGGECEPAAQTHPGAYRPYAMGKLPAFGSLLAGSTLPYTRCPRPMLSHTFARDLSSQAALPEQVPCMYEPLLDLEAACLVCIISVVSLSHHMCMHDRLSDHVCV